MTTRDDKNMLSDYTPASVDQQVRPKLTMYVKKSFLFLIKKTFVACNVLED